MMLTEASKEIHHDKTEGLVQVKCPDFESMHWSTFTWANITGG